MASLIRNRYEPLEIVARGGQSQLIKALDHQHDRLVALKVRSIESESEREELLQEARILLSLKPHSSLPLVREDFFEEGRYFLAMDWIEGRSLEDVRSAEGRPGLPFEQVIGWLGQVADALAHLHGHEPPIVHQDVKPANIVITPDDRAVLVDLGIATRRGMESRAMGTVGFTAPEVDAGREATSLADIYSLAATAFALLAGAPPEPGSSSYLPGLSRRAGRRILREIRRAMSYDTALRHHRAEEFVRALERPADMPTMEWLAQDRRLVTVMFVEVDLPKVSASLDPEELEDAVGPVIRILSDVTNRHGGYARQVAPNAIMCLFGTPTAREDDAVSAINASFQMRDDLSRLGSSGTVQEGKLSARIGINSGHVISRTIGPEPGSEHPVLGDAVELAQALAGAAPAGETYVGELTQRLTSNRFDFDHAGSITLEGRSGSFNALRLRGKTGVSNGRQDAPFGSRLPLVGREQEMALLGGVLDELAVGNGCFVALCGEPGVGKSRLSQVMTGIALEQGVRWIVARLASPDSGVAYGMYTDFLRNAAGISLDDPPEEAIPILRTHLASIGLDGAETLFLPVLGWASPDDSSAEPEAIRRGFHIAIAKWMVAMSRQGPIGITFEDFHWADPSSIALTGELTNLVEQHPILIVVTLRPEAQETVERLAEGLPDAKHRLLDLAPLGRSDVDDLLTKIVGSPPAGDALQLIYERTGGNPLFAQETIRSLQEANRLVHEAGGWSLTPTIGLDDVAPTLEAVLAARIDSLPKSSATVLHIASVVGMHVQLGLLAEVALEVPDLEEAIDHLGAGRLLRHETDGDQQLLVFDHPLIQQVAYARLLRRHRRTLHLQVAEAIERLWGSGNDVLEALARHTYLARAGTKAVDYLIRATQRAKSLFATEEAIEHLTHAVEIAREETGVLDLSELLLDLADLHDLRGHYQEAFSLYEEVTQSSDRVRGWCGRAAMLRKQGAYSGAIDVIDEAMSSTQMTSSERGPLLLERGWALSTEGRLPEAITALEEGLSSVDDPRSALAGQLLLRLARIRSIQGRFETALEVGLEAAAIFERGEDARGLTTALRLLGDAYTSLGRLDEAIACLHRGLDAAERVGNVEEIGGCLMNLGLVDLKRGNIDSAVRFTRRALEEFERVGHASGRAIGYANLAFMLTELGDYDEAEACARRAMAIAQMLGNSLTHADGLQALTKIHLRRGEFSQASVAARDAIALFEVMGATQEAADCRELMSEAESLERQIKPES